MLHLTQSHGTPLGHTAQNYLLPNFYLNFYLKSGQYSSLLDFFVQAPAAHAAAVK